MLSMFLTDEMVEKVTNLFKAELQEFLIETAQGIGSKIEEKIDEYNEELKPLNSFILPGGSEAASLIHLSRTIARRAERDVSLLSSEEEINKNSLVYLNRLSDLLFVLCRVLNENGLNDVLWVPGLNQK